MAPVGAASPGQAPPSARAMESARVTGGSARCSMEAAPGQYGSCPATRIPGRTLREARYGTGPALETPPPLPGRYTAAQGGVGPLPPAFPESGTAGGKWGVPIYFPPARGVRTHGSGPKGVAETTPPQPGAVAAPMIPMGRSSVSAPGGRGLSPRPPGPGAPLPEGSRKRLRTVAEVVERRVVDVHGPIPPSGAGAPHRKSIGNP